MMRIINAGNNKASAKARTYINRQNIKINKIRKVIYKTQLFKNR